MSALTNYPAYLTLVIWLALFSLVYWEAPARAISVLDENGSISAINIISRGYGYTGIPNVFLPPPSEANGSADQVSPAIAEVDFDFSNQIIEGIEVVGKGRGYLQPPEVFVEGGPCFLRITDSDSNHSGTFFKILSNTDDMLELSNPANIDLSIAVQSGFMVEVFQDGLSVPCSVMRRLSLFRCRS